MNSQELRPEPDDGDRALLSPKGVAVAATPADEVAAEIRSIRLAVQRFKPGSHRDPHAFPEQILAVTERLDALHTRVRDTFEERHLEAALDFLAHIMVTQGEVYAPIYDRLESELDELRRRRSPVDRAWLRPLAHTLDGGLKAIR